MIRGYNGFMRSTGIDIGRNSLKIVELEKNAHRRTLRAFYERELPVDRPARDPLPVIEVLRFLYHEYPLERTNVVVCCSSLESTITKCTVPFKEVFQINKIIKYETEQYVTGAIEEYCTAYLPVASSERQTTLQVFAVPKCRIGWLLDSLSQAALDPWAICPNVLGLARAARGVAEIATQAEALLIDLQADHTQVLGLCFGKIHHVRVIRLGLLSFVQPAPDMPDLSKTTLVLPPGDGIEEEKKAHFCARLGKEIKRSIMAFNLSQPPSTVYFAGAGGRIGGVLEALQNELGVAARRLSLPENVAWPQDEPKLQEAHVAVGLALIGLGEEGEFVNFRQGEFVYRGLWHLMRLPFLLVIVLLGLLFGTLAATTALRLDELAMRYRTRLAQVVEITGPVEDKIPDTQEHEIIRRIRQSLATPQEADWSPPAVTGAGTRWAQLCRQLLPVRGKYTFTIEELTIGQDEIVLTGRLKDERVLDEMRDAFAKLSHVDMRDTQTRPLEMERIAEPNPPELRYRYRYRIGVLAAQ